MTSRISHQLLLSALVVPLLLFSACDDDSTSVNRPVEQALGMLEVDFNAGSSNIFSSCILTWAMESAVPEPGVFDELLRIPFVGPASDTVVEMVRTESWEPAVGTLTNGEDNAMRIRAEFPVGGLTGSTGSESARIDGGFSGEFDPDFAGATITRVRFQLDSLVFNTPGTDPFDDGVWTDFRLSGRFIVFGTK